MEITEDAKKPTDMLCSAGVVLGNQAVLLKGINDDVHIMKKIKSGVVKNQNKTLLHFPSQRSCRNSSL